MMRIFRNRRAQTTAEYAILIAIVVGAVVAMQVYVRRGIQGRIKNVVDHNPAATAATSGEGALTFTGEQYEPYYQASEAQTKRASEQSDILGKGGAVGRVSADQTRQKSQRKQAWSTADTVSEQQVGVDATSPELPTITDPGDGSAK